MAVTDAIFMARCCFGGWYGEFESPAGHDPVDYKKRMREYIEQEYGYDLSGSLDRIRPYYTFNSSCQGSVPQAIMAFLESTDFEDAIRNAVSIGGDSDTIAAIAGSIAEAAYGIPERIREKAWDRLDEPLQDVLLRWERFIG